MSKLVIVESPAKAKTINRYLGKDYSVRASMGHVRDLPKSKIGVDIENNFEPQYRNLPDRKKILDELKKLAKKADEVFLATDPDREGEAIAWHLVEALNLSKDKVRRVMFNEITKNAVQAAFKNPLVIDENKVNAQQARRILDRIYGYRLSPLLWSKIRRGLSAGRVQSVAARLIVERERDIEAFNAEEYWEIAAELSPENPPAEGPDKFRAKLTKRDGESVTIATGALANEITEELRTAQFIVARMEEKEKAVPAPPPFSTSTLQQQASIQLRFSTKKTMVLAQQLYEGVELGPEGSVGLITYMRTDSFRVADQAVAECRDFIGKQFPAKYLPEKPLFYKSGKAAQGAHEAIRPTSAERTPESVKPFLDAQQFRLYELIWKRFVASQMAPGRMAVTDIEIAAGRSLFAVQGKRLLFDGHLRISGFDTKNEVFLPHLAENEPLKLFSLEPSQHFTKPPPRYSEATLVKTLEKLGIGRPSTYASIISTIQARDYVSLIKRHFHATELGKLVTDQLVQHFSEIMNPQFTSHMEDRLDEIEEAKADWRQTLREFYESFAAALEKAMENMKRPEPKETEFKCEKCGKPMLKRWSRHGEFLGCSGYPDCRSTMQLDPEGNPAPRSEPEVSEEKCEKCGAAMLIRTGRHGKFLGCSAYPKCKNTRSLEATPEIPNGMETCGECGKPMAMRRSRRGLFLGCSGYPACRNTKPLPGQHEKPPSRKNKKTKSSSSE